MAAVGNPIGAINNYQDMLGRISWWTGIVSAFVIAFIQYEIPAVNHFVQGLPAQWSSDTKLEGVTIPLIALVGGAVVGVISRATKLHDTLSDWFKIREHYDVQEILVPLALGSGAQIALDRFRDMPSKRRELMKKAFYPYAITKAEGGFLENHLVAMLFDHFFWYWVLLEICAVAFVAAAVFGFFQVFLWSAALLLFILVAIWVLQNFMRPMCVTASHDEIRVILDDANRRKAIHDVFDAVLR